MSYREAWIDRDGHRMYARDYPVQEPPIVLMHGFPDNVHLYDRPVGPPERSPVASTSCSQPLTCS